MRIVIINKYFYLDGGPERYLFNLKDYLESQGHDVIPFAMAYERNLESPFSDYFVKPAGGGRETKLDKLEGGIKTKLKIAARSIYSLDAKRALEKLIIDTKPDVIYCLNIVNHLSPSIISAAHKHNVPVVMRLSDYYLVCPSYLFLRGGKVCTDCERGYYNALQHKCIYGSLPATLCRVAGMYIHKLMRIYKGVGGFVTTTQFMKDKLIRAGFQDRKIHCIPTFVNASRWAPIYDNKGYILYFGRLTPEKGVEVLLKAYSKSGVTDSLLIVGETQDEAYVKHLHELADQCPDGSIEFLGAKSGQELQDIVYGAKYVVVPSIWYDNAPNVVYEANAAGKPVIGSALGGLCEQITEDTGILVEAGNTDEMAKAIECLSNDAVKVQQLGKNARQRVETVNSIESHVEKLIELFNSAITGNGGRI